MEGDSIQGAGLQRNTVVAICGKLTGKRATDQPFVGAPSAVHAELGIDSIVQVVDSLGANQADTEPAKEDVEMAVVCTIPFEVAPQLVSCQVGLAKIPRARAGRRSRFRGGIGLRRMWPTNASTGRWIRASTKAELSLPGPVTFVLVIYLRIHEAKGSD